MEWERISVEGGNPLPPNEGDRNVPPPVPPGAMDCATIVLFLIVIVILILIDKANGEGGASCVGMGVWG